MITCVRVILGTSPIQNFWKNNFCKFNSVIVLLWLSCILFILWYLQYVSPPLMKVSLSTFPLRYLAELASFMTSWVRTLIGKNLQHKVIIGIMKGGDLKLQWCNTNTHTHTHTPSLAHIKYNKHCTKYHQNTRNTTYLGMTATSHPLRPVPALTHHKWYCSIKCRAGMVVSSLDRKSPWDMPWLALKLRCCRPMN